MESGNFFGIQLWAIIGPPKSGKSSIIGALTSQTGKGGGGARHIFLRSGGWLLINAFRQSLQEAGWTPEEASKKILKKARKQQTEAIFAYHNVLLALRSDQVNNLPEANEYLAHFIKLGWNIKSLVLLQDEEKYGDYIRFGVPLALIPNSSQMTSFPLQRNWVFGAVRNHFNWA